MTKKVFFLGAGFSKAIDNNYPLMPELTNNIEQKIAKSSIARHYREIAPLIKKDIEALLTYLSTDFPWKDDTRKYANLALYEEIVKLIAEQFSDLAEKSVENVVSNNIGNTLAQYVSTHLDECNFITLNYDLLLEETLLSKLRDINSQLGFADFYKYPMAWIGDRGDSRASFFTSYERENKPNIPAILKLHGSANWFWAGVNPSDIIYYRNWNKNEKGNIDMGLKPYIIPPVMDKNAFYNHIAIHALWQQAEKLLKEADEVYIIGFSFPQTDLSVKYLFQSALRKSNAKIYVVNPEKEETLRVNYNKVFGDDNKNVCYDYSGRSERDYTVTERFISEKCKI